VDPTVFAVWMAVLRRTPGAVLWVPGSPAGSTAYLRAEAAAHGVAPARVHILPWLADDEHLTAKVRPKQRNRLRIGL
jgi:predicted O-linked N-acetylglucosamine transferase (SPINDLY family)